MKKINLSEYNPSMGILIDVRDEVYYQEKHHPNSINIPYDRLLLNHHKLLNNKEKYYLVCTKGHKSKRAVSILEFYGYDVTQVINDI